MTWVTVSSSVLDDAPGYVAEMAIAGGAMVGYWAMGSVRTAITPASIVMMASTHAKMGRSMKKRAMRFSLQGVQRALEGALAAAIF
jgi:hypothetical protein